MINFDLQKDFGFKWYSSGSINVKGYAYLNGVYLQEDSLINFFEKIKSEKDFSDKIKTLNGCFSVVLQLGNYVFFAVDHIRSIPLFFSVNPSIVVTDSPEKYFSKDQDINVKQINSIVLSGFSTGKETLHLNIFQIQAGEYGVINTNNKIYSIFSYYSHKKTMSIKTENKLEYERLHGISVNVFKRLIKSLNNRTAVVPLSGGYDSRYIVAYLKHLNYDDVICYSYGKKNSYEVEIAQSVAKNLGYKWFFVEYNSEAWDLYFTKSANNYVNNSHSLSSLPHIQDFPSICYLTSNKLIPTDSVIIPGYCGDYLGGSLMPSKSFFMNKEISKKVLIDYIYETKYSFFMDKYRFKNFKDYIFLDLDKNLIDVKNQFEFIDVFELWVIKNYISKFIINSVRFFEHYEYQWRLPLWDLELVNYWNSVDISIKRAGMYDNFLLKNIFKKYNIDMKKSFVQESKKEGILGVFRSFLKNIELVQRLYSIKKDVNSFDSLIDKFLIETKCSVTENKWSNRLVDHYNAVWFLENFILDGTSINKYLT